MPSFAFLNFYAFMKKILLSFAVFYSGIVHSQNLAVRQTTLPALLLTTTAATTLTAHAPTAKKPKNVIVLIGDGMGVSQIYAGMIANKKPLHLERAKHIGFHKNQSADKFITDSAAGATAIAIGKKAKNGAIGVDAMDQPSVSILELSEQNGMTTGLVTTSSITDATPASFISHQPKRSMNEEIAADFLKTDIEVFIGGGRQYFSQRKDGQNLIDSLSKRQYQIANSTEEIQKITSGKLAAFTGDKNPIKFSEGRNDQLKVSAKKAIDLLSSNKKGFFLMVEGAQIDWGGHANDTDYIINEMLDFDGVIGEVLNFAEKDGNTLVIITADHETGGFAINGGDAKTGQITGGFTTKGHTGVMIPVFAYGPGAESFSGFYENTEIFHKIKKAMRFK